MVMVSYLASLLLVPLAVFLVSLLYRGKYVFLLAAISSIPGILALLSVLVLGPGTWFTPIGGVFGNYSLQLELLSATFLSFSALVFFLICLHLHGSGSDRQSLVSAPILVLVLLFCSIAVMADDILLILISWEGVSLSCFLLCGFHKEAGRYSWRFFAVTHLGGLLIISALILLAQSSGSFLVSGWSGIGSSLSTMESSIIIIMLVLGFGTKFGLVPFHVWMPGLYHNSPPHSVALVSAVSSNVALFLLVKLGFSFFVPSEASVTIALAIMGLASISAIFAALQSLMQDSPMRVLAFSSMKNMSLVVLMLGLSLLFAAHGADGAASLALLTAILHTLYHSLFKSLSVLGISDAQAMCGSDVFIGMGGMGRRQGVLSALVLVGVLSMAALPPFNGFVSEWMMIQSMMEGFALGSEPYRIALPLGVAVLGLSGALGAAAYLRLYGLVFLGRPRKTLETADFSRSSSLSLGILAFTCIASAILAAPLIRTLSEPISILTGHQATMLLSPPFTLGYMDPAAIALILVILTLLAVVYRGQSKMVRRSRTWDCGSDLGPDMQYSAMSFSQPVARVFQSSLGMRLSKNENEIFPASYLPDHMWEKVYSPLSSGFLQISRKIRSIQGGSVQSYLAYILAVLMLLMVALR